MRHVMLAAMLSATGFFAISARSQDVEPSVGGGSARSPFKAELERGYRLKTEKRDAEAAAAFSVVLAKDPTNHAALTELGYLNMSLKHYASAVKYLGAASAQDPGSMRLHMDLGYAQQSMKRYDAAAEQFSLVAAQPGEMQDQARQALETVKAASPAGNAKQRHLLEQGYAAEKRGDKAAASRAFEAAAANDPKDTAALKQLGFLNFDAGKLSAAAANFEAVRALDPNDYFVALQLGYTYDRLKKKQLAREAFGAALASTDEKIHGAAQTALQLSAGPGATAQATSL